METDNTFVTIKKSDGQNFYPYILGTFSKNQRAIPFRTYNYQTEKEKVVFKIIEDPQKNKRNMGFFKAIATKSDLSSFWDLGFSQRNFFQMVYSYRCYLPFYPSFFYMVLCLLLMIIWTIYKVGIATL